MTKTAWVFPGQGSQLTGMGWDLQDLPAAKAKFAAAETILGWSVLDCCQGDAEVLGKTLYTQPCLYVIEAILADQLRATGQIPDYVAGHSLGEYSALYAAGVFDFEAGLRLIQQRALLMHRACDGQMAALLGADRADLEAAIAAQPDVVLANDNNAQQVVISGTPDAVSAIINQVKAKRAVVLNVSGAFHSPLMAPAAAEFQAVLDTVAFSAATLPVLSNVDPLPSQAADVLKARLAQQMTGAVRWREISLQLPALGVSHVVEVGPGKVLSGITKRTCPELIFTPVGTLAELAQTGAVA
jgi:[acyl-carrier-protein] S-malonyltransferase